MTLLARISRLFKADIHGILDILEEPETLLKQAVREMEEEIEQSRQRLKQLEWQKQGLEDDATSLSAGLEKIERQIDCAFAEADESLVKSLIRKKLEVSLRIDSLERRLSQLKDKQNEWEGELIARNEKLESVREKLSLFSAQASRNQAIDLDKAGDIEPAGKVAQEDVELAFLEEKRRRAQNASGEGEAS
ncbi:MAG: PspA/IM30 family protein [Gammaproteobacteria bacterium]